MLKRLFLYLRESSRTTSGVTVLLFLIGLLLFIPRLSFELGMDEYGSFWVVKDGFRQAVERSVYIQGQSPFYYCVLWCFSRAFGFSELALRLPSVIAVLGSSLLMIRLGERLFTRTVGIYAAFGFISCAQVIVAATEARPYGLAIALAVAASIAVIEWGRSCSTRWMAGYCVLLIATTYAHYLFALVLPLHGLWLLTRYADRKVLFRQSLLCAIVLLVAFLPAMFQLNILAAKTAGMSFVKPPTFLLFLKTLILVENLLLVGLLISFQLTIWRHSKSRLSFPFDESKDGVTFLVIWLFLPVAFIYAISFASGHSIFLERYFAQRVLGVGLLSGVIMSSVSTAARRVVLVTSLIGTVAITQYARAFSERAEEGYGAAIRKISEEDKEGQCRLLLLTGFIEAQTIKWLSDDRIGDFIRSPLSYYKINNKVTLLPYSFDTKEGQEYHSSVVRRDISDARCIWLLYKNGELFVSGVKLNPSPIALEAEIPELFGLLTTNKSVHGSVELIHYRRTL